MGASGAGKSTLLDILANRKTTGNIEGEIYFNGKLQLPTQKTMRINTAYVMQDNIHIGTLTVGETLMYAAQLRLSEKTSIKKKQERVNKIATVLGLNSLLDSKVGDVNIRGISGGQLKRLSIAVEIVHLPDLIFLDEPTTGLDSSLAYEVIAAVRNLANQNRTIISTIHQPSAQTFELFDKLLLLAAGFFYYYYYYYYYTYFNFYVFVFLFYFIFLNFLLIFYIYLYII
jgi:ABC-type multidrug transport system ATPase subunit